MCLGLKVVHIGWGEGSVYPFKWMGSCGTQGYRGAWDVCFHRGVIGSVFIREFMVVPRQVAAAPNAQGQVQLRAACMELMDKTLRQQSKPYTSRPQSCCTGSTRPSKRKNATKTKEHPGSANADNKGGWARCPPTPARTVYGRGHEARHPILSCLSLNLRGLGLQRWCLPPAVAQPARRSSSSSSCCLQHH